MAHILVVDDEPDIAMLVRVTLEANGHAVSVAGDGATALRMVDEGAYDAVILDVTMPGMDGFEVLTALKSDPEPTVSSIPVIMLTARTGELDRIKGGIEGAVRYMTKPFAGAELQAHLDAALVAGQEPEQRRAAQRAALEHLARLERGDGAASREGMARPRLSRLGRPPEPPAAPAAPAVDPGAVDALSDKQRELLGAVRDTPTVQEAAERLRVSRSNVYASLRRIARRLAVPSVPELVTLTRSGVVLGPPA
jgi:CheY-like chemotaxis protein/DNA-binding CsgD family transcriptional regulator